MTGQLLVDPAERRHAHPLRLPPGVAAAPAGRPAGEIAARVPRHAQVRPPPSDRGRPGSPAGSLGPDAWKGEWDAAYLARRLRGRTAPLKAFLLDQRHLAGIGNIYADEILWWTALSPLRAGRLSGGGQVCCLAEEIRTRLAEGVRLLGCTLSDFVDTEGQPGGFQDWLQAYGRQGQECRRCGGTMVRRWSGGGAPPTAPTASGRGTGGRRGGARRRGVQSTKKRAPSGLAFHLSSALTSFPLRCTPRPFTFAFPPRVPL